LDAILEEITISSHFFEFSTAFTHHSIQLKGKVKLESRTCKKSDVN